MDTLKIAIQKSGRLHDDSLKLLRDCGINVSNGKDQLRFSVGNFPLEILYLRNSDIPKYLESGVADAGIFGENLLIESEAKLKVWEKLGFSKCRLSIAVPKETSYTGIQDFKPKRIATSYPNTVKRFLEKHKIDADVHVISGSVEIAPNIGLADAICDLVSSGNTLFKNGLKECEVLFESEAVLVSGTKLSPGKGQTIDELLFRIRSVLRSKKNKYVLMNVPNDKINDVSNLLPVLKSPTIMPLAEEGWSSLHSVIKETEFWAIIHRLKKLGAQDILVIPIDKMVL